jgi:hypothetical protein
MLLAAGMIKACIIYITPLVRRVNVGIFLEKLTVVFCFFFSISTCFFFQEKKVRVKIQVSLALETEFRRFFWSI